MEDMDFWSWAIYTVLGCLTILLVAGGSAGRDWVYRNKYSNFKRKH